MAFDDGTPLDAAALQSLETKLNEIKSAIPKVGTSITNITNVTENTTITNTQKEILWGITAAETLVPGGQKQFKLPYEASSTPKAIIMSPVKAQGTLRGAVSWYVEQGSIGPSGATAQVYLEKGSEAFGIKFYYIVICG